MTDDPYEGKPTAGLRDDVEPNVAGATHLSVSIDGRQVFAAPGETLLQVAQRAGVEIPTLCHDARLRPTGACRMCLVESSDSRRMVPACRHPVADGLAVITDSDRVQRHRRGLLRLYAADAPLGVLPETELRAAKPACRWATLRSTRAPVGQVSMQPPQSSQEESSRLMLSAVAIVVSLPRWARVMAATASTSSQ